jgi:hypothetical protein
MTEFARRSARVIVLDAADRLLLIRSIADLRPVAFAAGRADLGWASGLFRDDFFLHRVDRHRVDPAGWPP